MKWVGGTIAGVFLGFVFIIIYVLFKSGSFKPVTIQKSSVGPFVAVYKNRLGPYHESSKTLNEVENILKDKQYYCTQSFGYYLDDPNETHESRLRSELGCLFSEKHKEQLNKLNYKPNVELKTKYFDTKNYVVGTFEGSPALVSLKVYPKIKKWSKKNRYKLKNEVLEIYEVKSNSNVKTTVLFEIIE